MPLVAIALAVCLITSSLMLQPYAFQSLKPMGGVGARPLYPAAGADRTLTLTSAGSAESARAGCAGESPFIGAAAATPPPSSAVTAIAADMILPDLRANLICGSRYGVEVSTGCTTTPCSERGPSRYTKSRILTIDLSRPC